MKPFCRHFDLCGGCSFQDIDYEQQISRKQELLRNAVPVDDISLIKSPRLRGFRNKMEFSFEGSSLGLHPKKRYDKVIDLKECPVFSPDTGKILNAVRKFAADHSLPYYSRKSNSGLLRYLIVRESKFTDEKMIVLVVSGNSFNLEKEFGEAVAASTEGVKSVIVARRHSSGDTAVSSDYESVYGRDFINMKIGEMKMKISPYTFFQPNSFMVEKMYSLIKNNMKRPSKVLDLYSGAGAIALFLGGKGMEITGVESLKEAVEDARENLDYVSPRGEYDFINEKTRKFLSGEKRKWDYIVMDPPRGGISYRVWLHIKRLKSESGGPEKIFYISCSLKNLAEDINFIKKNTDWKIKKASGVDQFVHTPHLETVVEIDT
ncbi:MAG: class I SAM-dependent RNA methyltransferase [Elusimicrobiota bacterium]